VSTFQYETDKDATTGSFDTSDYSQTLNSNARIGANVAAGDVRGRFEYGTGSGNANIRLLYGEWDFGAGKLLVGQDYTPVTTLYSNQTANIGVGEDSNMLNMGAAYDSRRAQIKLKFGGFQIAFIEPSTGGAITTGGFQTVGTATGTIVGGTLNGQTFALTATTSNLDTETSIPKIALKYGFKSDKFFVDAYAGYNTYDVRNTTTDAGYSVDSYVFGVGGGMNFGPAYFKANVYSGQNTGAYGLAEYSGTTNAVWNSSSGNDFYDQETFAYLALVGFKLSDMVKFEAGYGALDQTVDTPTETQDDTAAYYLQAVITFAPGVFIVPEIGMIDYDDVTNSSGVTTDEGDMTWVGLKWQINF
jgi:hypothetical protein